MAIYALDGTAIVEIYEIDGEMVNSAYDIAGTIVFGDDVDYSRYTYSQKWASKGVASTQGFDIYDGKVFWVSKSGNSSIPANCYVWNLSDGSQALSNPYITVYSGHGNNLAFAYPVLYASPAYQPSTVYVNSVTEGFVFTLIKTLVFDDGSTDCDVCVDEENGDIIWTLGHTAGSSDRSAPFLVSKWDTTELTDNGDGTYTPKLMQTVQVAQPSNSYFCQGCRYHDGILWFANGYAGVATNAYVFGVDPDTGEYLYTIDCETTAEPEGLCFYPDESVPGGYALYIGFQGMALRKYTFAAK